MTTAQVHLAGIGAVPLSAIPKLRDMLAAGSGQPAEPRFDEARWLIEECGFRL